MFKRTFLFLAALSATLFFASPAAEALPTFSKKYDAPCGLCHDVWPNLTATGLKFKMNGYQMPDSEDGGETDKLKPEKGLFLDIGDSNPPISVMLEGGLGLLQAKDAQAGPQQDKIPCCVEGNAITLLMAGTVAPNIAYKISLPWGKKNAEEAYLRFVNAFAPGMINIDIGAMPVMDYDTVVPNREWFKAENVAFQGHPDNENGREIGMTAPHNDTGIRVYGRPGFETFTYEAGLYTGAQVTGPADDDSDLAYTAMGRIDTDHFSVSLRYWGNKTGLLDQTVQGVSGESLVFRADSMNADETVQEFILGAKAHIGDIEIEGIADSTTFGVGGRTTSSSDGIAHTLAQDNITRIAATVDILWRANSWFMTGIGYGYTTYNDYQRTLDGQPETIKGEAATLIRLRAEIRPVVNMRIGLEIQLDTSGAEARLREDGTSFGSQHRISLQWDMLI